MTMPVMEPDLDAAVLRDWARAIDDGPFASLCWGERMAFDNPETLTLMGADGQGGAGVPQFVRRDDRKLRGLRAAGLLFLLPA
jgi:hypothetical protein